MKTIRGKLHRVSHAFRDSIDGAAIPSSTGRFEAQYEWLRCLLREECPQFMIALSVNAAIKRMATDTGETINGSATALRQ